MNTSIDRRMWLSPDFMGLFVITALMMYQLAARTAGYDLPLVLGISFAIFGGLASTAILKAIGYFSCLRVVPRKSDGLLLVFSVSVSTFLVGETINHLVGVERPLNLRWALPWSPVAALMIFAAHYTHSWVLSQKKKRRIVLKLSPKEAEDFKTMIQECGLAPHIEILDAPAARRELRKQNGPDIDLVVISRNGARAMEKDRFLIRAHLAGISIVDRRQLISHLSGRIRTEDTDLWSFVSTATRQTEFLRVWFFVKNALEPIAAAILLVVFAPLLIGVAIAIKMSSPGPIIYSQLRSGYLGRSFRLFKFRSMRTDSEVQGYQWATKEDPRITKIGKFIRKTRIDELPQLWNVVKGDMGFIGPRPERPEIYRDLKPQIPMFSLRTNVRPGITGWAQVCAGYAATVAESKLKLEYDLYYMQHMSPRLDIIIVVMTIKVMMFGSEYIKELGMPGMSIPGAGRRRGGRVAARLKETG